jgi:hypothetical protein
MLNPIVTEATSLFSTLPNRIHVGIAPRRALLPARALLEVVLCLSSAAAGVVAGCLIMGIVVHSHIAGLR